MGRGKSTERIRKLKIGTSAERASLSLSQKRGTYGERGREPRKKKGRQKTTTIAQ